MFWHFSFWLLVALLILPLPFKLYGYLKGTDDSKLVVKIEESANAVFMAFGLIGFYGYLHRVEIFTPIIWQVWLVLAILWSILAVFWSPKLALATEVMGKNKMRLVAGVSCLIYFPMLLAVYFYAF